METNPLDIRCIFCGSTIKVRNQEGIENLHVECPNCHKKFLVGEGRRSYLERQQRQQPSDEDTDYGQRRKPASDEDTIYTDRRPKGVIGQLVETGSGQPHQLREGLNYIGRASSQPKAAITFADPTRKMSREHAIIEVHTLADGSYCHKLRNWKNQNPTYVGTELLAKNDCVILQNRQIVRFASVTVQFILPDDDATAL